MSNILPHSALAACNHEQKIQVFFQQYNGQLAETATEDGTNFKRTKDHLPAPHKPKTFTPLASISYENGKEIRVYYLNTEDEVQELAYTGGKWMAGELNKLKQVAASYSRLAVVHFKNQFRVYFQRASDNKILELIRDGTQAWKLGPSLREAIPGSSLTAVYAPDGRIRVFFQATDFTTHEVVSTDNWKNSFEIRPANTAAQSALAIINISDSKDDLRLYSQSSNDNALVEYAGGTDPASWSRQRELGVVLPVTKIAAVTWGHVKAIRVYALGQDGKSIVEKKWGEGGDWRDGAKIPTA